MKTTAASPRRVARQFRLHLLLCAGVLLVLSLVIAHVPFSPRVGLPHPRVAVRGPLAIIDLPHENELIGFSPDGRTLLTAKSRDFGRRTGPLRLWDVGTGKERFAVAVEWKHIETILFSPDGSMLAAHEQEGDLKLWDMRTGKELAVVSVSTKFANWVNFRFTPYGRLLAVQDYRQGWPDKDFIRFWDVRSKKDVGFIEGNFWAMSISPDSKTAATFTRKDHSKVDRIMLWGLEDGAVGAKLKELHVSADEAAFSANLTTFATADRSEVQSEPAELALWDLASGASRTSFSYEEGDSHIQELSFLAGGKVLWASGGGGTQLSWHTKDTLWDVTYTPKRIETFSTCPVLSPDGKYVAVPKDNGADLYLVDGMKKQADMTNAGDVGPSHFGSYNNRKFYPSVVFAPGGRLAAVTGVYLDPRRSGKRFGSVARLWDAEMGQELMSFPNCQQVVFSPGGKTVATLEGGSVRLWALTP